VSSCVTEHDAMTAGDLMTVLSIAAVAAVIGERTPGEAQTMTAQ
jgi:hypothetical protein